MTSARRQPGTRRWSIRALGLLAAALLALLTIAAGCDIPAARDDAALAATPAAVSPAEPAPALSPTAAEPPSPPPAPTATPEPAPPAEPPAFLPTELATGRSTEPPIELPTEPAAFRLARPPVTPSPTDALAPPRPVGSARAAREAPRPRGRVPILMYHYIRVNPDPTDTIGFGLSVRPADFEAQMAFLAARGYRTVLVGDLVSPEAWPAAGSGEKLVAITFDDGYADAYAQALPVLRRYGLQATFYLITGLVGRPGYLSWDEARALADAGMAVGSHSVSHPDLTRLPAAALARELAESRAELERRLGRPALDFCYPSGRQNAEVVRATGQAGYRSAVTTRYGYAGPNDDLLALPRVRISGGTTLEGFARALDERLDAGPLRPAGER